MVIFGRQTLDNGSGLTSAQTARVLGLPMLGLAGQIKVDAGSVTVERVIEEGRQTVSAKMPVVLSVVQSIGEPRYPSFMGIRKASKANIPIWTLGDLGIDARAPGQRMLQALQDEDGAALGGDKAISPAGEGATGARGVARPRGHGAHRGEPRQAHLGDAGIRAASDHHLGLAAADGRGGPD